MALPRYVFPVTFLKLVSKWEGNLQQEAHDPGLNRTHAAAKRTVLGTRYTSDANSARDRGRAMSAHVAEAVLLGAITVMMTIMM